MPQSSISADAVRVIVVDDSDDLRFMLRLHFARDPRFEVVGEAANGRDAIELAAAERPDLMILDRQMPLLGGLEAMPEIRRVSPDTAIVLYAANDDPRAYQAALDAGAFDVLEKTGAGGGGFIDRLVDALVERASAEDATTDVRVGPVSGEAARAWVANTAKILDAVSAHPEILGEAVPADVFDLFRSFLRQWAAVAEGADEFRWVARARLADVRRIVEHWATIDSMSDDQLRRLGVHWSPPEGQPFFQALTTGVLDALRREEETQRLAARLVEQWAPYRIA